MAAPLLAQPPRPVNPAAVRGLDREQADAESQYIQQLDDLADRYEEAGAVDRAKDVLRKRLRLAKDDDAADRLEGLENLVFEQNKVEVTLNPADGWMNTGLDVRPGEVVRIEAEGSYRVIFNQELGPAGVKTESIASDFLPGAPLGTLVANVFPPRNPKRGAKQPKYGDPQPVGESADVNPDVAGRLFLKVNLPPEVKAIGELRVTISGQFTDARPPAMRRSR